MRKIDMIIVHCTATPEGREVSVADIDRWHKDRGWKGIGYHKVIHLDGSISDGRPIEEIGAHAQGYNRNSIGVAYVGGVTANDVNIPKDTRTIKQQIALEKLLRKLSMEYPIKKIIGHRDVAAKACPSFDATSEYKWILGTIDDDLIIKPTVVKSKINIMSVIFIIILIAVVGFIVWRIVS